MKSFTATVFTVILLLSVAGILFSPSQQAPGTSAENPLLKVSQASFPVLDSRITKCTVAEFVYELNNTNEPAAPLFENMGTHHYTISTTNDKAQVFFDQGLKLVYGFNHSEAHRSFMEAARLDPDCAMAYWGQAYALGPNINDPLPDLKRRSKAYEAVTKALQLAKDPKEHALITALSYRYDQLTASAETDDASTVIMKSNEAYMQAMKGVRDNYPDDPEILTFYAASVMNTMPWQYWDKEANPKPGIQGAKEALEQAIKLNPDHPGAHHYYIHLMELPYPDMAINSADRLGKLIPAAGHLVHMPSHIYIRIGRFADAVKSNIEAVDADEDYISQCYSQGSYPLGYYPHNIHFLWSAATMIGDSKMAIDAARKTAEKVPVTQLDALPFLQDFYSTPMHAYVRFGNWNEILTIPDPSPAKHVKLMWHYARGIAFLRKDNLKEAEEELMALDEMMKDETLKTFQANFNNNSHDIGKVAQKVLAGEVAAAKGNYTEAINLLNEGVANEDALFYNEPAAWHIPVRQTLGAVLLKAGMPAEAEKVYRKDLVVVRNNGWSLIGLINSLKAQNKTKEITQLEEQLNKLWSQADKNIDKSVL